MRNTSVVVVSRGDDMSVVLTSLLAQDAALPLHCVLDRLPGKRDGLLLDALRRTGWTVSLNLQRRPGVGQARFEAAEHATGEIVICLDDDAMLKPHNALRRLSDAAPLHSFASPVIRYLHSFEDSDIPAHSEIWETVTDSDPRVAAALAFNGDGWRRVYDYGTDQPTDDLGGTAFAVMTERYREAASGLAAWQGAGEDHYLGKTLCAKWGKGLALSGVYAYHVGIFQRNKWGFDAFGLRAMREHPEVFRSLAVDS